MFEPKARFYVTGGSNYYSATIMDWIRKVPILYVNHSIPGAPSPSAAEGAEFIATLINRVFVDALKTDCKHVSTFVVPGERFWRCTDCQRFVAASGVDGGSWVLVDRDYGTTSTWKAGVMIAQSPRDPNIVALLDDEESKIIHRFLSLVN
jgi:hypothetical protein